MTTTAAATLCVSLTDSSGALVQLRVVDNAYLYVESQDTKQQYELKYIYGIDRNKKTTKGEPEAATIVIHYCHVTDPQEKGEGGGEQTITNFRNAGIRLWERRTLHFQATTTADDDTTPFINEFRKLIYPTTTTTTTTTTTRGDEKSTTRVMVMLNPAAGTRQALRQWETIVRPMLSTAGFTDFQVTHTQPNGKTRGLAEQLGVQMLKDKQKSTIVLCMGGDGTTHEVVNGLSDAFDKHVWKEEEEEQEIPTFRLGIIPSGSGNAFSLSLNLESIENGVLQVIKGRTQPLRLIDVSLDPEPATAASRKQRRRILVVMSWGFHAQLVSKSRYLQPFMGNTRFSWVAMYLMTFLQQHQGELTMKDAQRYDATRKAFVHEAADVVLKDKPFTYFLVGKQHSMERGFKIAPFASPTTGEMDVVMMRGVSREELKAATIKVLDGGRHVEEDDDDDDDGCGVVEYYKTPELLLRVKHGSELCLDGEIVDLAAGGVAHLKMIGPSQGEPDFQSFV
ncbi:ATP-NAD kinase-like domain-containing protein [Zychaea mexicana]|uniref:ATP-NAD kinase-like domain-containing protein n=1 Tax=Zychaea mexicana TaxID=64656 RepID=UPI0022FE2128|nr:ATP-NAD kinase-like domain-containing protein [Zychaea mexicana]KAI9491806.1 ATP-NAD kinase-like domain-containing protein [Zychaea mexicana]